MTTQLTDAIVVIADNVGGLTLQIIDNDEVIYQHYYDDPAQCAYDIKEWLRTGSVQDWDGNELADGLLTPIREEIINNGYKIYHYKDLLDPNDYWGAADKQLRELLAS